MKRSDFISDERLQELIRLLTDLPEQFRTLAEQAHTAFSIELSDAEREKDIIAGEVEFMVRNSILDNGKSEFNTEAAKKAEVERRLLEHTKYQAFLADIRRYKEERNRLYRRKDECEMQFKGVLTQASIAKVLQETENLVFGTEVLSKQISEAVKTLSEVINDD